VGYHGRIVRVVALLLLTLPAAADEGLKAWSTELRRLEKAEQKFWQEFQKRFTDAMVVFEKPRVDAAARPNDPGNYVYDYSELRNLYTDHALIEEAKGKADLALAASGDPKALPELFDALMNVAKRIDDVEATHLGARAQQGGSWFDQRPGIERHGLALRMDALVRAVAGCPGSVPFLAGDGMKTAAKKDGKRSIVRRVAVVDALGLGPGDEATAALTPVLAAPESSLRIAAVEALLRCAARAPLEPLLGDRCPPVRRALLQGIATMGAGDPGWIEPVLAAYGPATGTIRDDCVRALEALTNQKFGDAKTAWDEWFEDYKAEIAGGKFKKDAIEVREAKRAPAFLACSFYGIPTPSLGMIFVLEGSRRIFWPADVDALKKAYKETWHRTRRNWEEINASQHATLLREFDKAAGSFAPDVSFGALVIYASCTAEPLGDGKLVHPEKREIRNVRKDLEKLQGDGWCPQYEGLLAAAALAGMPAGIDADFPDARADTIYLWDSGGPEGGRYMTPESAVAAFKRFNRFRRLVVHAIRIGDEGEPADALMKGLAEASQGTYLWTKKPNP
jgi:HEAT repeat protein